MLYFWERLPSDATYRFIRLPGKDISAEDKALFNFKANEYPSGSQEDAEIGLVHMINDLTIPMFVRDKEAEIADDDDDDDDDDQDQNELGYHVSDATADMAMQFDKMLVSMQLSKLLERGEPCPQDMEDVDWDFVTQWVQDFNDLLQEIPHDERIPVETNDQPPL